MKLIQIIGHYTNKEVDKIYNVQKTKLKMAEKGAHLTGTTFIRPSIFEIIAQESLAHTVEPAFTKFLSVG